MLYLFGASDNTYPYADQYVTIYLLGSLFVMAGLGMNSFINSQGFGRIGMMTVLLGAVANIILDPIFIFVFHRECRELPWQPSSPGSFRSLDSEIPYGKEDDSEAETQRHEAGEKAGALHHGLGLSGFTMSHHQFSGTDCLQRHPEGFRRRSVRGRDDGDHSIREVVQLPVQGLTNSSQP